MRFQIGNKLKRLQIFVVPSTLSREKMAEIVQKKTYNNLAFSVIRPDKSFWEARTKICRLDPSETAKGARKPYNF